MNMPGLQQPTPITIRHKTGETHTVFGLRSKLPDGTRVILVEDGYWEPGDGYSIHVQMRLASPQPLAQTPPGLEVVPQPPQAGDAEPDEAAGLAAKAAAFTRGNGKTQPVREPAQTPVESAGPVETVGTLQALTAPAGSNREVLVTDLAGCSAETAPRAPDKAARRRAKTAQVTLPTPQPWRPGSGG